ncbi:hypothetical protein CHS0354_028671 [Potamilus streckersoni]|uniref:Uncharacterized protein n=1 Tax=Potamilus streckersoni TaxID=2493646 RepID=A0AAE0SWE2_9BIVA|nr:hypothetical protein CHS0354_028671 [Potamilus streckersoni]
MSGQSKGSMAFRFFIFGVLVLILADKCFGLIGTTKGTTTIISSQRYKILQSLLGQKQRLFEGQLLLTKVTNMEDKLKIQEYCKSYEGSIKALILESLQSFITVKTVPEMISTYMPATCNQVRNDMFGNGTAEEMFNLIIGAKDNIGGALEIIFEKTSPTEEVIRSVMPHLLNIRALDLKIKTMSAVIGAYIESKGGVSRMTLNDFAVITPDIIFAIPLYYYRDLPVDVLNNILDFLYNCTVFVIDQKKDDKDFKMDPDDSFSNETSVDQGQNSSSKVLPYSLRNYTDENEICQEINFLTLFVFNDMEHEIRPFCDSLFGKYRDVINMRTFRKLLFMMFCAPVRTCQAVPNNFVQDNIEQLREIPWPCNPLLTKEDPKRQFVQRTFSSAETCGRIFAEKAVSDGKNALDIKTEADWIRIGPLSSCLSDDYLFKAAKVLNCSIVAKALDVGLLPIKVANAVKQRCFEAPHDPALVTCTDLKNMGGFIATLSARFLEGISLNETCEPSCMQFLKDSLALPVDMKKTFVRKCFGADGVVLDSAALTELGGDIAKLPMKKLGEIPGRDILSNIQAIKETIDTDMINKGNKAAVLTRLAGKIMEAGGIKELAKHEEFMQTISVRELKSTIKDVVKDLGLDDPQFVPNFPDSQNKFLMKKMLTEKPADNFTVEDLRSMKSLVKGFLSQDIQNLGSSHLMEKAVVLCEQSNWPEHSLKAINRLLIKGELVSRSATQPLSKLTPQDVSMLGCECLINFEPWELLKMTLETCMSVCKLVGTCDNFRCFNPLHRSAFATSCLQCMGTVGGRPLSAENADRLGSNIIQNLSPGQLMTLISKEVVQTRQRYFKNACLVPDQMSVLGKNIIDALGSPSSWKLNTVSNVGSNIQFLTPSEQQLIDKSLIYKILENISAEINPTSEETLRLRECCERWLNPDDKAKVHEARRSVGVTLKDAIVNHLRSSNSTKRKRVAVSFTCTHIQIMGKVFATEATIDEVNAIQDSEFSSCLPTIGLMTGWSSDLLTALLAKSEKILGDVCNMTTEEFVSLNYIATALSTEKIGCLSLDVDDIVAALGQFSTWSDSQLSSLASRYMTERSLTNLANITAAEITSLRHMLCGFSSNILSLIPPSVIGASGQTIGKLDQCPTAKLQTIKQLATHISAYGPVVNWTAADVSELGIIIAGLTDQEIQQLTSAAIEGIAANIIPKIPPNVLSAMTITQLAKFSDIQTASITMAQKSAMSAEKQAGLPNLKVAYLHSRAMSDSGSLRDAFGVFILYMFLLLIEM